MLRIFLLVATCNTFSEPNLKVILEKIRATWSGSYFPEVKCLDAEQRLLVEKCFYWRYVFAQSLMEANWYREELAFSRPNNFLGYKHAKFPDFFDLVRVHSHWKSSWWKLCCANHQSTAKRRSTNFAGQHVGTQEDQESAMVDVGFVTKKYFGGYNEGYNERQGLEWFEALGSRQ